MPIDNTKSKESDGEFSSTQLKPNLSSSINQMENMQETRNLIS